MMGKGEVDEGAEGLVLTEVEIWPGANCLT